MKKLDKIISEEESPDDNKDYLARIWDEIPEIKPDDDEDEEGEVDLLDQEEIEFEEPTPEPEEIEYEDYADDYEEPEELKIKRAPKKVYEDVDTVSPTFAKLDPSDISEEASPRQRVRIDELSALLSKYGVDINNYDPQDIIWREWDPKDIKKYNNLINYIKFDVSRYQRSIKFKKVDPYAMAQINEDLWPDISIEMRDGQKTTVRQAIKDRLDNGDPLAWSKAEVGTELREDLQVLYAATREYYRRHHDKASQIDNMNFMNTYSEYNTETPTGVTANLLVGLWKVKGTDVYIPISLKDTEKAQDLARKEGRDEITMVIGGERRAIEPVLVDPAEIKPRMSFGPRSGRRMVDSSGWSRAQKVGALNNAIANLFSGMAFSPAVIKRNPQKIDWDTITKLSAPINFYKRMSIGVRGNYLLGWEDQTLLQLYRMFVSVLPSTSQYDKQILKLEEELETTKDEQRRVDIEKRIKKLQDLIDNPPSPNREEWDRNFLNGGEAYPARVASPSDQLEQMTSGIDDLYLYKYKGPNPDLHDTFQVSRREYHDLDNYEFKGPLRDVVELGVGGELRDIEKMIDKAREELKRGDKDIVNVDSPAEDIEEVEGEDQFKVEEGIVTSPATIIVNGSPFKLHLGDRLIIDSVKSVNSQQK